MSSSDNFPFQEKVNKDYSAMHFSDSSGIVVIDTSLNSAAGRTYSNICITKMNHNRFLITADVYDVYSSAQIKDYINKNKDKTTPEQILTYYGIKKEDYFFYKLPNSEKPVLMFRKQKLISIFKRNIKIDCPNYAIISES